MHIFYIKVCTNCVPIKKKRNTKIDSANDHIDTLIYPNEKKNMKILEENMLFTYVDVVIMETLKLNVFVSIFSKFIICNRIIKNNYV